MIPLQGKSFWESSPPMGPAKSVTCPRKDQATGRRKRRARKPRPRFCLLKGCEQKVHPQQARQRYCSEDCRSAARRWSQWKAKKRYREPAAGLEKRNSQSRRYRERVKSRKAADPEAVNDGARVIIQEHFFRAHVRQARLLRALRAAAAKSFAALLFARMPSRPGASCRSGAALETSAHLIRT